MLENLQFTSLDTSTLILSYLVALLCGILLAFVYGYKYRFSKNMIFTLIVLPCIVQSLIVVINGNLGTSVAVLGTFSLVRFRSAQGNAKDITFVFLAMTVGICTGVGAWPFALMIVSVLSAVAMIMKFIPLGEKSKEYTRYLKVSVPDDVSFKEEFKEIFEKYTTKCETVKIKTSQLGSVYTIEYNIVMKEKDLEKELIDELRIKNSNLPIVCNSMEVSGENNERVL